MNLPVNINGRQVQFSLHDETQRFRPGGSVALSELAADIIVRSFHPVIAATVKAVVVSVARTGLEIAVEVSAERQNARVTKKIKLKVATARKFSDFLMELGNDNGWDPDIKSQLEESLRQDLKNELRRLHEDW